MGRLVRVRCCGRNCAGGCRKVGNMGERHEVRLGMQHSTILMATSVTDYRSNRDVAGAGALVEGRLGHHGHVGRKSAHEAVRVHCRICRLHQHVGEGEKGVEELLRRHRHRHRPHRGRLDNLGSLLGRDLRRSLLSSGGRRERLRKGEALHAGERLPSWLRPLHRTGMRSGMSLRRGPGVSQAAPFLYPCARIRIARLCLRRCSF